MTKIFLILAHFFSEKLRWLVVIIGVLLITSWLKTEWEKLAQAKQQYQQHAQTQHILQQRYQELQNAQQQIAQNVKALQNQAEHYKNISSHLQQQLTSLGLQRQALWDEHWLARLNPLSETSLQIQQYDLKINALTLELNIAQQSQQLWQNKINNSPVMIENRRLLAEIHQTQQALTNTHEHLSQSEQLLHSSLLQKIKDTLLNILPMAISILLAAIFTPILIKLFLYFIAAPIVSRLKAVYIEKLPAMPFIPPVTGHVSKTSLTILLSPTQEIVLHPDYLQSFSQHTQKSTQWFLNASIPLTSLAAGLVTLVRLRNPQPDTIQLASMHRPFEELVIINLPAKHNMVCKPRALVGVIKDQQQAVIIRKYWRLWSLHSWLTLQLRYLVFEGPCQLIIKGSGGVVIESAQQPRLIQQNATLGFSSHLAYSNYRCETFVSYYLGKDALFNDRFQGESGFYFYEQAPLHPATTEKGAKRVEGIWDAVLKVFGI